MTRLSICSFVFIFVFLISGVVAQDMFGLVTVTRTEGDTEVEIKPEINDWGGSDISVSDGQKLGVKYGSDDTSYDSGDYVFSEYGKMVGAEFDAKRGGEYFLGNLRVDIPKGAKVVFKNGEISITDPGKMITKDDVDLVKSDLGWDETELKLSGDGVDYMGLKEVGVDSDGIFLRDPEGVEFDDFKVYGEGKVYLLEDGEPNTEIKGAYLSVNPEAGKFTIGSNMYGGSVSVMPKAENKYGLKHDVGTDYIAFKSISGGEISYLTLQNRQAEGLTPKVDAVGYFAVDDDTKSIYVGEGNKLFTNPKGNSIIEFGSPGTTISPIEITFAKMEGGQVVSLSAYGGAVLFGNDGGMGYGNNPKYVLGGKYGKSELYHGVSNLLSYNYYGGGKELIEKMFKLRIVGGRQDIVNSPTEGKKIMDLLFQTPVKTVAKISSIEFMYDANFAGRSDSGGEIEIVVGGEKSFSQRTINVINHEIMGHLFSSPGAFNLRGSSSFLQEWKKVGGYDYHIREYWGGSTPGYESLTKFTEYVMNPTGIWAGATGTQRTSLIKQAAVLAKYDAINVFQAKNVMNAMGVDVSGINTREDMNKIINA